MTLNKPKEYWDQRYGEFGRLYGTFPSASGLPDAHMLNELRLQGVRIRPVIPPFSGSDEFFCLGPNSVKNYGCKKSRIQKWIRMSDKQKAKMFFGLMCVIGV